MRIFKFSFLIILLQNVCGYKGVIGRMEGNSKQWFAQARNGQCLYSFNLPSGNKEFGEKLLQQAVNPKWFECATDGGSRFRDSIPGNFPIQQFDGTIKVEKTTDGHQFRITCYEPGWFGSEIGALNFPRIEVNALNIRDRKFKNKDGHRREAVKNHSGYTYRYQNAEDVCAKIKAAKSYFESFVNNSNGTN